MRDEDIILVRVAARKFCRAFTLLEMLISVAVIGLLAALIFPSVGHVKKSAALAKSVSNLRTLGSVSLQFANDNNGQLPYYQEPVSTYKPNTSYRLWWFQYLVRDYCDGNYAVIHDPTDDFKTSSGQPRYTTMNTTTGQTDLTYSYAMNTSIPQPNATGMSTAQKNARSCRLAWLANPSQTALYMDTCEAGAIGPTTESTFRYTVNGDSLNVLFCDGGVKVVPKTTLLRSEASKDSATLKVHRQLWYGDPDATTQVIH